MGNMLATCRQLVNCDNLPTSDWLLMARHAEMPNAIFVQRYWDGLERPEELKFFPSSTCDETSYNAGFDSGVKAMLQQLAGLINGGADIYEIDAWIDEQWER